MIEAVSWPKGRDLEFAGWFHQELTNTLGNRATLERTWADRLIQWRAKLPTNQKDFPWIGASNLEYPLTGMHSDPVYADFMETLHAPEDYWGILAKRKDRVNTATPLRRAMTALEQNFLKMRKVNGRALQDNNILGTAVYKNHWLFNRKMVRDYTEFGTIEKVTKFVTQPLIEHVPLQHFIIPAEAWSIDPDAQGGAVWVAERFYSTPNQLRAKAVAESDFYPAYDKEAVEKVINWATDISGGGGLDDTIRREDGFLPWKMKRIELFEVWSRFDIDNDGIDDDIVVVWHQPTMTILRTIIHPLMHGARPYHSTNYLPGFGFYGIGIAELDEWAQLTATKLLNATIDNVLVGNTIMIDAPEGANIVPGEPIYPGKVWLRPAGESVKGFKLGEINPSIITTLQMLLGWSEQRTGVNEIRQGSMNSLPSRTPATSLLSMLREGNKRFDMIMSNFREVHSEMGLRMLQNLVQFRRDNPTFWDGFFMSALGQEDAQFVLELLDGPVSDVEASFGVHLTATSAQVNKEAEKQSLIGLLQITTQVYGQLVQTATILQQVPPGSPAYETASASYSGGVELIKRLLERFDIENPSQYLGNMEAIAGAMQMQSQGMNAGMPGLAPTQLGMGGPPMGPYPGAPPQLGSPQQMGGLFGL